MKKISRYAKVTELNGRPRLLEALPLAMQHVVAMIVGCVTPAIILAGVTGLEAFEQIIPIILAAGFIPKFASLMTTIPSCVLGEATVSMFAVVRAFMTTNSQNCIK